METKFEKQIELANPMSSYQELFDKLNTKVEQMIGERPFSVNGTVLGFKDGGKDKLPGAEKFIKMFSSYDMTEAMSWNEPDSMNYMVCNIMRHGLRTYNLYNKEGIMVGSKDELIFLGFSD